MIQIVILTPNNMTKKLSSVGGVRLLTPLPLPVHLTHQPPSTRHTDL